jgi:hypothetical protein
MAPVEDYGAVTRRARIIRALVLGVGALALLLAWDGSRQPTAGSTWTLLAVRRVIGEPPSVRVLGDQTALASAWEEFRLAGSATSVDLSRVAAIWFSDFGAQACPSRLDDVTIDIGRRLVTGLFSRGFTVGCDDRQVPDNFLVLIDRDRLPPAPYRVDLADPFLIPPARPGVDVP